LTGKEFNEFFLHISDYEVVTPEEETAEPIITDIKYGSVIRFIHEHTGDKKVQFNIW
jgi:hypothetical protein